MSKPIKITIVWGVFLLIFIACAWLISHSLNSASHLPVIDRCIDTFDEFVFSYPLENARTQLFILPLEPWEFVSDTSNFEAPNINLQLEGATSFDDIGRLWASPDDSIRNPHPYIYVFNLSIDKWNAVSRYSADNATYVEYVLFPDNSDHHVVGITIQEKTSHEPAMIFIFTFDENTEQFVTYNVFTVPSIWEIGQDKETRRRRQLTNFLFEDNTVWMFNSGDGIYSLEINDSKIDRWHDLPDLYTSIGFIHNGGDLVALNSITAGTQIFDLRSNVLLPLDVQGFFDQRILLIDDKSNFWLEDSMGYITSSGSQHVFWPSLAHYLWQRDYSNKWLFYSPPDPFLQTSDGRLWFDIARSPDWDAPKSGIAWYDPLTNEGCWFTSESSTIIEDAHGNLWLMIGSKLYVYPNYSIG